MWDIKSVILYLVMASIGYFLYIRGKKKHSKWSKKALKSFLCNSVFCVAFPSCIPICWI